MANDVGPRLNGLVAVGWAHHMEPGNRTKRCEVLDGLVPGDRVILSDMSTWDAFDRIRLD